MFLCRPFRIDLQFFIVFSSFFLLSSVAFARVFVRGEDDGVTSSTAGFEYKAVMSFNKLQEKEFASPRWDFDTKVYGKLRGKPFPVIGAAYQNSFSVVSNTNSHGGSEKVGKHARMPPNKITLVPMVEGTRGNNYFGCLWAGLHPSNRIDIIEDNNDVYQIQGKGFKPHTPSKHKNVFADGEDTLPHVFMNVYCFDCQIKKIVFYSDDDTPFHTDQHTIGWFTDMIKPTTLTTTTTTTTSTTTTTTSTTTTTTSTTTTTTSTTTTSTSTTTTSTTTTATRGVDPILPRTGGGFYYEGDSKDRTTTTTKTKAPTRPGRATNFFDLLLLKVSKGLVEVKPRRTRAQRTH